MPYKDKEKERKCQKEYRKTHRKELNQKIKNWKKANKDKIKDYEKKYLTKLGLTHAEYQRKYYTPENRNKYALKNRYGITVEDFKEILKSQNNRCPICENDFDIDHKGQVDHDHNTSKVRGILHMTCNVMLGLAKEKPEVLERAANYIRNNGDLK